MEHKLDFKSLRPKLKEVNIFEGERNIVIEDKKSQGQVVLPKENLALLHLFDGEQTVKDISSSLYHSEGAVSFNSIITTIRLLSEAHLIDGVEGQFDNVKDDKSPHEQKASILIRPLLEFKLLNKINSPIKSSALYYCLAGIVILSTFALSHNFIFNFHWEAFLKSSEGYADAIPRLVIMSSIALSFKTLIQALLLSLSTGMFYGPYLRLNLYSLFLGLNDNSIYSHPKKSAIISYSVASASTFLFGGILFGFLFPESPYLNDYKVLSVLLTLIELNPYRKSEMTRLFHFFYAEEQLKSITPYLKNCSLTGILSDSKSKLTDELRFVLYSILAFSWAIGFSLFSIDLLTNNLTHLLFQVQVGEGLSQISAGIVAATLVALFAHLSVDLFHTVMKNIFSPLFVPLTKMKKKSSHVKEGDISHEQVTKNLSSHMLFNQLSEKTINFLMKNSHLKRAPKETHLILQGDTGKEVFFIVSGEISINVRDKSTGRVKHIVALGPNTVIGEMAILGDCKRTANATTKSEVIYLEMPESVFEILLHKEEFQEDMDKLKKRIEISQFVSSANLFRDFPPEIMNLFVEAGDLVLFPEGHHIVEEGESDKTFYLLIRGSVDIYKSNEKIAELGQGDFFGEVALIANVPRTASVKTTSESLFLYIEDKKFWNILSDNVELAMYIESIGRSRMEEAA